MKSIKLLISIACIIIFANILSDQLTNMIGSNYGKNDLKTCLNDPKLNDSQHILIGTSVTREINLSGSKVNIKGDEYFVCGISAPITNFDFHFLIANLLHNKINLKNRNIMFEVSLQGILESKSILTADNIDNFLPVAPLSTKIFWLKSLVHDRENLFKNPIAIYKIIKAIIFPTDNLQYLEFENTHSFRKNNYLNKVFDHNNTNSNDFKKFEGNFNEKLVKFRAQVLVDYVTLRGGKVAFYLPPNNEYFITKIIQEQIQPAIGFLKTTVDSYPTFDARELSSTVFFADCCHFNFNGINALTQKLRSYDD